MRFETRNKEGFMAEFAFGKWFNCRGTKIDSPSGRFRPWED